MIDLVHVRRAQQTLVKAGNMKFNKAGTA